MKTITRASSTLRRLAASLIVLFLTTALSLFGQVLDNGIDAANLGKGDWIYFMSAATNHLGGNVSSVNNVATLMSYEKSQGMAYIIVKAGDAGTEFPTSGPQFTTSLVNAAHAAGLKIFAYSRSWGTNVTSEINLATTMLSRGADGFVIDAEAEWESGQLANAGTKATQLCQGIKNAFPTRFLAHSPFMYISLHSSFPYKQFGLLCDAVMPQAYFTSFGITPSQCVSDMDSEWRNWQNSLTGTDQNAIKPIVPVCQAWNVSSTETTTGAEITTFINGIKNDANPASVTGYKGVNFWRADLHTANMWSAIGAATIGGASSPPVISSVAAGSLSSSSATITWNTDISSDSVVNYGTTTSYGTTVSNASLVISHSINLTGLTAATTYHYRVRSKGTGTTQTTSGDFTFTTNPSGVVSDIIIDNPAATVVGSWSSGTTATDKFGTDYRFKAQGTGSASLKYTPNIVTAGSYNVYEWHSVGSNRTTGAPEVITFSGGSQTITVNQQLNGGQWNPLGTYTFAAGTAGSVKITDASVGSSLVVIADAIKFEFVSGSPTPSAPSGLTATAAGSSQINLAWTDNSGIENNFVVARSTTAGGPYTDIAILAANTTSYSDTGLSAGTTYYYVVRATNGGGSSANSNQASAITGSTVADIIIDNPSATVVGSWSTGTTAPDRFGADYRFASQGIGAAYLQYAPNILTPGTYQVYEWHSEGSNRTAGAPHVVAFNGGTQTLNVDQTISGGQWNLLGSFSFTTGTGGNVKITDAFAESTQVAIADAVKFVYAGP
ncbi:MAG: D-alanyl-D-alanine carboxypeptidase precursor [Pedosphaera sp.]|nr:D-alanyl-D-alanine carboxypeptidase precursor [Pedosphaera sp.]